MMKKAGQKASGIALQIDQRSILANRDSSKAQQSSADDGAGSRLQGSSSVTRKDNDQQPDDYALENLSVTQLKQIISYVRAMEQSSLDLSDQMVGILGQIDSLERENKQLRDEAGALEQTNALQVKEIAKMRESVAQKNEQIARLDNDNNQLKDIIQDIKESVVE